MYRKSSNFLDYGIEGDIDPKIKFNSLLSATVSTIMCLAAKCPLPKCNVETTKLFLRKITDDTGQSPRNVKAILRVLEKYNGPYTDTEGGDEKRSLDELLPEKAGQNLVPVKDVDARPCLEYETVFKGSQSSVQIIPKDGGPGVEGHVVPKRTTKGTAGKRSDKDPKKLTKTLGTRASSTKSMVGKL